MKYLASDLDGTLIQNDESIKKEDLEALLKFKEKGNKFIVSTGRKLEGIKRGFKKYPEIEYDYAIGCNGGIIVNNKDEIIYEKKISSEIIKEILKELFKIEGIYFYLGNERAELNCKVEENGNVIIDSLDAGLMTMEDVLNLEKDYSMIALGVSNKSISKAEEIKDMLNDTFEDYLESYRNQWFVDIVPKNCSKGSGIKMLSELLDIDIKDIVTIGDSYNDLPMFELNENSYTFTYSEKEVQSNADNIVNTVAECINKII